MKTRKRSKNHWNYRIVTKLVPGIQGIDLTDLRNNKTFPDERVFSVVEVYYHDNKPDSYVESKDVLGELDSKKSIRWTLKKIKKAFKKPILDLDNFPNEYKIVKT
jgi:hypothetical protein